MKGWLDRIVRTFSPPPVTEEEITELAKRTEKGAEQARRRDGEVRDVVRRLAAQREENHFGPLVWAAIRGESDV